MNGAANTSSRDNIPPVHRYHLHYITLIKGSVWFIFLFLIALYLPNFFWNNKTFSPKLSLKFFVHMFNKILIKREFMELSYLSIAVGVICWLLMFSSLVALTIYILRFFNTCINLEETILTYKKGLIFISEREIDIRDADEIFVNSGVLGTLLNYGYITFVIETDRFTIPNVDNSKDLMRRLNHLKAMPKH